MMRSFYLPTNWPTAESLRSDCVVFGRELSHTAKRGSEQQAIARGQGELGSN